MRVRDALCRRHWSEPRAAASGFGARRRSPVLGEQREPATRCDRLGRGSRKGRSIAASEILVLVPELPCSARFYAAPTAEQREIAQVAGNWRPARGNAVLARDDRTPRYNGSPRLIKRASRRTPDLKPGARSPTPEPGRLNPLCPATATAFRFAGPGVCPAARAECPSACLRRSCVAWGGASALRPWTARLRPHGTSRTRRRAW